MGGKQFDGVVNFAAYFDTNNNGISDELAAMPFSSSILWFNSFDPFATAAMFFEIVNDTPPTEIDRFFVDQGAGAWASFGYVRTTIFEDLQGPVQLPGNSKLGTNLAGETVTSSDSDDLIDGLPSAFGMTGVAFTSDTHAVDPAGASIATVAGITGVLYKFDQPQGPIGVGGYSSLLVVTTRNPLTYVRGAIALQAGVLLSADGDVPGPGRGTPVPEPSSALLLAFAAVALLRRRSVFA
jgi:hypothetical protein